MNLIERVSFWLFTLTGIVLLLTVGAKFVRPSSNHMELTGIGICVVIIWATFLLHQRTLKTLEGQVEERSLDRLSRTADSLGGFGYLILLLVLIH